MYRHPLTCATSLKQAAKTSRISAESAASSEEALGIPVVASSVEDDGDAPPLSARPALVGSPETARRPCESPVLQPAVRASDASERPGPTRAKARGPTSPKGAREGRVRKRGSDTLSRGGCSYRLWDLDPAAGLCGGLPRSGSSACTTPLQSARKALTAATDDPETEAEEVGGRTPPTEPGAAANWAGRGAVRE